jgi:peptide/nickel transport system substrate-binding protein
VRPFNFGQRNNPDKKLIQRLNQTKIPKPRQLKYLFKVLNPREQKLFLAAAGILVLSTVALAGFFYLDNFIPVPTVGGEYTEGLIGAPQYINPLLSQTNDVDSDITHLIFSGLLRFDSELRLVPDLAERWSVNDDQTQYIFVIRDQVTWHDGQPLTADDIIFTVRSIQDTEFKSPLLVSLRGVQVEKRDERTVIFTLPEAYPAFFEVLTFGILPEHIWGEIPAINANLTEYNLKPIGSGPWKFKSLTKDRLGNIKSYVLEPNPTYYGPQPYLEKITFKFYADFDPAVAALKSNAVEGISFLPKKWKKEVSSKKPRYFSIKNRINR